MEYSDLFQFSVENALEIIVITDTGGTIVYANTAAKEQLEFDELLGNKITDIFPGDFQVEKDRLVSESSTDGTFHNFMAYRGNKTCFPAKVKFFFLENCENSHMLYQLQKGEDYYICVALDVSTESFLEKKASQAGQEAEAAQRVKSEFVANVTHELRTPVNGIQGNIQELMNIENDSSKVKILRLMERGCRDMNAIINNILDFSKLEAGKFTLERRPFQFRNMIEYVRGNHSHRITEKGLEFSITISPEIPETIIGDELRIVQILNNLISNAYKFTDAGRIHVEIVKTAQSASGMELFFMVMDTGIGIAKADQDKLFRSFSQVDASISRKYGGTGLGLNICKQLVELMGGSIHVASEYGKGTTFSFHIWVEIPKEDVPGAVPTELKEHSNDTDEQVLMQKLLSLTESQVNENIWIYGTVENKSELEKRMSKLILSIEMGNWEKAEMFAESIKKLAEGAPREIKSAVLRMKMNIQKAGYEKSIAAFEKLRDMLKDEK